MFASLRPPFFQITQGFALLCFKFGDRRFTQRVMGRNQLPAQALFDGIVFAIASARRDIASA